jgi:hypothetical protein
LLARCLAPVRAKARAKTDFAGGAVVVPPAKPAPTLAELGVDKTFASRARCDGSKLGGRRMRREPIRRL